MRSNLKFKMPRSPDKIISDVAKSKQKSKKVTVARAEPKLKQPCAVVELAPLWSVQCNHKRAQRKLQNHWLQYYLGSNNHGDPNYAEQRICSINLCRPLNFITGLYSTLSALMAMFSKCPAQYNCLQSQGACGHENAPSVTGEWLF